MIVSGLDWSRDCVEIGAELLVITKHLAFWVFCSLGGLMGFVEFGGLGRIVVLVVFLAAN